MHDCSWPARAGWSALFTHGLSHWFCYLICKAASGLFPPYLQNYCSYFPHTQDLYSLSVPRACTELGNRAFLNASKSLKMKEADSNDINSKQFNVILCSFEADI